MIRIEISNVSLVNEPRRFAPQGVQIDHLTELTTQARIRKVKIS